MTWRCLAGRLLCIACWLQVSRRVAQAEETTCASSANGCVQGEAQPAATSPDADLLARLMNRSYLIFRKAVSPDKVARAKAALDRPRWSFGAGPGGAQRISEILELDPVFAELVAELPEELVRIADKLLSPYWQVGSYHGHVIYPEDRDLSQHERVEKGKLALHSDFPYGHATQEFGGVLTTVPEQFPYTLQLIWILSPFTEKSGSTMIYPGSHQDRKLLRNRTDPETFAQFTANAVQVTGEPGDLVLYIGQAWHIWGVNEAGFRRMALLGQVLPFFFKHMESHALKTPAWAVRQMAPRARERLGFAYEAWFRHSSRLLPFPRSPLEGLECLLDMLVIGYNGPFDVATMVKKAPGIPESARPVIAIGAELIFQANRMNALFVLFLPFLVLACTRCHFCASCCRSCTFCTKLGLSGYETLAAAAKASMLLFIGMVFGVLLLMDRLSV